MKNKQQAMAKPKRIFDIRAGDEWSFTTNNGTYYRTIIIVADSWVKYRMCGSSFSTNCLKSTFRRWWKGAELHYATDWSNRDESGETLQ